MERADDGGDEKNRSCWFLLADNVEEVMHCWNKRALAHAVAIDDIDAVDDCSRD